MKVLVFVISIFLFWPAKSDLKNVEFSGEVYTLNKEYVKLRDHQRGLEITIPRHLVKKKVLAGKPVTLMLDSVEGVVLKRTPKGPEQSKRQPATKKKK